MIKVLDVEQLLYKILPLKFKVLIDKLIPYTVTAILLRMLTDSNSFLDIGCGRGDIIRSLKNLGFQVHYTIGVDVFLPYIKYCKYNYYCVMLADARYLPFKSKSIDVCGCFDLIEHLEKYEGENLIQEMERIARKQVIIFTPNGFLGQKAYNNNVFQVHKSGYTWLDFEKKGYIIKGVRGLKILRGERAVLRYKFLGFFVLLLSIASQLYLLNHPKHAFQILCIKNLEEK